METVKGEYGNNRGSSSESYFTLTSDQYFNYSTWQAPIHWNGFVGGKKVSFIQIENTGSDLEDYDWSLFPKELELAKKNIIKAIDDAMRGMD